MGSALVSEKNCLLSLFPKLLLDIPKYLFIVPQSELQSCKIQAGLHYRDINPLLLRVYQTHGTRIFV